jgi:hypothetical protein
LVTGIGARERSAPCGHFNKHDAAIFLDVAERLYICHVLARERGIGTHLDGARLFIATAYTGISSAAYAAPFDTVSVSLWKCFNCGTGAILAGPKRVLEACFTSVACSAAISPSGGRRRWSPAITWTVSSID